MTAPGEARRPTGGLPTAGPRTFPAGGCLGGKIFQVRASDAVSTILSGRVGPFQRAKKARVHGPGKSRSERLISLLAEAKTAYLTHTLHLYVTEEGGTGPPTAGAASFWSLPHLSVVAFVGHLTVICDAQEPGWVLRQRSWFCDGV